MEQATLEGFPTIRQTIDQRVYDLCGEACKNDGMTPLNDSDVNVISGVIKATLGGSDNIKIIQIKLYCGDTIEVDPAYDGVPNFRRINKRVKKG